MADNVQAHRPPAGKAADPESQSPANDSSKLGAWGKPVTNAWGKGSPAAKASTPVHQTPSPAPSPAQPAVRKSWAEMARDNKEKASSPMEKPPLNSEAAQRPEQHQNARAQSLEKEKTAQPRPKSPEISVPQAPTPVSELKPSSEEKVDNTAEEEAMMALDLGELNFFFDFTQDFRCYILPGIAF
jgi:hypothetical protein